MIKHIVLWKLKEHSEGKPKAENAVMLKRELELMTSRIKEIRKLEVGINFNSGQDAYDLALFSEFATKQDLETYQNHPEHQRVVAILRRLRETRVVADYEIPFIKETPDE
jgi:hypothetical protein